MPKTKFQKLIFTFLTVIITVHLFVFYNVAIEKGSMSNQVFFDSLKLVPIEFIFAFFLQTFFGGPISMNLAFKIVNPQKDNPFIVKTVIICCTIIFMCPAMSFVSTILYNGLNCEFFAHWAQNIVFNFPFAFFTQIFFIQPIVRKLFKTIFKQNLPIKTEMC